MRIQLEAKSNNLKLTLEISSNDPITKSLFSDPKYALGKRLTAVSVGLRSELSMFLLDIEKEFHITK